MRGASSSQALAYGLAAIVRAMPSLDPTAFRPSVVTQTRTVRGR